MGERLARAELTSLVLRDAEISTSDTFRKLHSGRRLPLGGRLDGRADRVLVFTIPVEAGFGRVEDVFGRFAGGHPGYEWYYGNVCDPADGVTPLGWWVE